MNTREELVDLLSQAKRHLIHFQEIGFDAPTLSPYSLQYLRKGIQLDVKAAQETFYCNSLAELEKFIGNCDKCKLSKVRNNIVLVRDLPMPSSYLLVRHPEWTKMSQVDPL